MNPERRRLIMQAVAAEDRREARAMAAAIVGMAAAVVLLWWLFAPTPANAMECQIVGSIAICPDPAPTTFVWSRPRLTGPKWDRMPPLVVIDGPTQNERDEAWRKEEQEKASEWYNCKYNGICEGADLTVNVPDLEEAAP